MSLERKSFGHRIAEFFPFQTSLAAMVKNDVNSMYDRAYQGDADVSLDADKGIVYLGNAKTAQRRFDGTNNYFRRYFSGTIDDPIALEAVYPKDGSRPTVIVQFGLNKPQLWSELSHHVDRKHASL